MPMSAWVEEQRLWDAPAKVLIASPRSISWYSWRGVTERHGLSREDSLARINLSEPITRSMIRDGDTCLDIGANEGVYALRYALAAGPSGRVLAFEPDPANAQIAMAQGRLNRMPESRFRVSPVAVGESFGRTRLHSEICGAAEGVGEEVDVWTIDSLKLDACDFVKIDTEGYEVRVLRGMRETLETFRPRLVIEVHLAPHGTGVHMERHRDRPEEIAELLVPLGYRIERDGAPFTAWETGHFHCWPEGA